MNRDYAQSWDKVYQEGMTMWHPSECVIRFISRNFKKQIGVSEFKVVRPANNALDIGCGNGANVLYLRKLGYNCYGVDISKTAVDIGNSLLQKNGFAKTLISCDMEDIDFESHFFDIIISHAALDHVRIDKYNKIVSKIKKILTKEGYIFITLRGREAYNYERMTAKAIEPHTLFTCSDKKLSSPFENPHEKAVPQHFFTLDEIENSLNSFEIVNIEKIVEYGGKKLEFVDSRWFVTAKNKDIL